MWKRAWRRGGGACGVLERGLLEGGAFLWRWAGLEAVGGAWD